MSKAQTKGKECYLLATPYNMARLARLSNKPVAVDGVFSYCHLCGKEVSASSGDYFNQLDNEPLMCCGEPMMLAEKITRVRILDTLDLFYNKEKTNE